MTEKTRRRDLFRPLQLVGLSLLCGLFAGVVTLIATGAFTEKVMRMVTSGTYADIPPWNLAFIVTGGIFIASLLILSILILAVDPADFSKPHDRPVLYDKVDESAVAASAGSATAEETNEAAGSAPAEADSAEADPVDPSTSSDDPGTSGSANPSAS